MIDYLHIWESVFTNTVSVITEEDKPHSVPFVDYPHEHITQRPWSFSLARQWEMYTPPSPLRVLEKASLSRMPHGPFYTKRRKCLSRGSLGDPRGLLSPSVLFSLCSCSKSHPRPPVTSSLPAAGVCLTRPGSCPG